jgi:serine/threonine protein kinase
LFEKNKQNLKKKDLALSDSAANVIEYGELEVGKLLGEGSFAKVYQATYNGNKFFFFFCEIKFYIYFLGKTVAIKQLNNPNQSLGLETSSTSSGEYTFTEKSKPTSSFNIYTHGGQNINHESLNYFSEFQREAWLMSGIDSPYLVKLEGIVLDPLCLVMEFLPFGSLYQMIHEIEKYPVFEENFINKIALNIARGMNVLHTSIPQVIHRDLKSPNVLVCSDSNDDKIIVKVADFGLSRFSSGSFFGREVWNPYWLAPEIIANKEYNEKSDVYRFIFSLFLFFYFYLFFFFIKLVLQLFCGSWSQEQIPFLNLIENTKVVQWSNLRMT